MSTKLSKSTVSQVVSESTDIAVEEKMNPAAAAMQRVAELRPVLNIVDDETKAARLDDAAKTIAVLAFLGQKTDVARLDMFNALTATRLMFPAADEVRKLLGDDAPDLRGQTPEYNAAITEVYAAARKSLVSRLRRDGYLGEMADNLATARIESLRKTVSLDYRKHMELVAAEQDNPAAFLLAHGFEYNTAIGTKKAPQAIPAKTSVVLRAEDGTLIVGTEGDKLVQVDDPDNKGSKIWKAVRPTPKAGHKTTANEPKEQGDQVPPTQDADHQEAAVLGDSLLDPQAIINQAIGMLNRAAGLIPGSALAADDMLETRNALRQSLLAATSAAAKALVPAPAAAKVTASK